MKLFALAPSIIPQASGFSVTQLMSLGDRVLERAKQLGIECTRGSFGAGSDGFDLYSGATDAGADYRQHFVYRFSVPPDHFYPNSELQQHADLIGTRDAIEVRLFDEMIAIATVNLEVNLDLAVEQFGADRKEFDCFVVRWVTQLCLEALKAVGECVAYAKTQNPKTRPAIDLMSSNTLSEARVAWVHKVFVPELAELSTFTDPASPARNLVSERSLVEFSPDSDYFGWGDSIKVIDEKNDWRDGCVLSQYFYFALDRFNRALPALTQQLRSGREGGSLAVVKSLGMRSLGINLRHRISEKDIQYADFFHGIAGECRIPVEGYDLRWRFNDLRRNLASKLPILQDVLTELHDQSQRRTNATVESMLFFVSFLSLVSLFLSSHDYVAKPAKDKVLSWTVVESMLPGKLSDILSLSVGVAFCGLLIFASLRFSLLQKIMQKIRR